MARGTRVPEAGATERISRARRATPTLGAPAGTEQTALHLARSSVEQLVAQQATLAHIGQRALAERSIDVLFADACALVGHVLDTELVALLRLTPDGTELRLIEGIGWRPGVVGEVLIDSIGQTQSGYTIEIGGPVIVPDLDAEERFVVWPAVREHGAKAGMSVRIGGGDHPFGAMSAYTKQINRFTRDDANFLQAVANVLAAAVERDRIESELRSSRDQLAAIVSNIDEGITVLTPTGLLFANDAAAQLTGFADGAEMARVPPQEIVNRFEIFAEDGRALADAELPSRRAMMGEDQAESILGFRIKATGEKRWSSVRASAIHGAAGEVTHVITTFRDVTEERWSNQMKQFMVDATAAMSGTLDIVEAAQRLTALAVPQLADYCTVDLLEPDGTVASVALAHSDPDRLPLVLEARSIQHISTDAPSGPGRVIRDGTPEFSHITLEMVEASGATDQQIRLLKGLELRWYLCVPLVGRHGPIGALSLIMAHSGRDLGERELALATELGLRAGIALENAQLYKTANDRRAQLDTVLAALAEAVIVYDGNGRLRLGNRAAAGIFESSLPPTLSELWRRLTSVPGGPAPEESGIAHGVEVSADGGSRWFELRRYGTSADRSSSEAAGAQQVPGPTVVVLRDVTQERAARAARDAFLGVLSHELRTPITTIYGGSELLERGLSRNRKKEVIADIRIESERLVRLVEDLLVMTRVERDAVETGDEPVLMQHLLASIIANGRWENTRITLRVGDRLPAVRGDATYIEQVVRNLLTNAIRYGRGRDSGIEVQAVEDDGWVVVRVLDHGGGLGGEDSEKLFDLFYRSASARAIPGGAGIGLFVSRHLVEAMGGRIWARERPEGGAEFGFSMPIMEPDTTM